MEAREAGTHIKVKTIVFSQRQDELATQLRVAQHQPRAVRHRVRQVQVGATLLCQLDEIGQPLPLEAIVSEQYLYQPSSPVVSERQSDRQTDPEQTYIQTN